MDFTEIIEKLKKYWKILAIAAFILILAGGFYVMNNHVKPQAAQNIDSLMKTSASSKKKPITSESKVAADKVTVDVKGEVKNAGIFTLNADARVNDAIKLAGGFTANADQKSVNLAGKLADEEVIYVANVNENAAAAGQSAGPSNPGAANAAAGNNSSNTKKVNLNTADLTELQTLSGIGAKKAQDIIDYRTQNGSFKSVEDLGKVSGFGDKTVERLKDSITVD